MADSRTSATLADDEYRERIRSDFETTMLVEAGAGTGKTTCLVDRMVGLVRSGKCRVETLAAVTFTRKAAAELRTRFQFEMSRVKADTEEEQTHLEVARSEIERCFIGTIHSFCARLLRERPVEAGVDPGFIELDESLDQQLREQAWREHVTTLVTTNDPILPELESLGLRLSSATKKSSGLVSELDELGLEPAELGPAFLKLAEFPDVSEWPAEPVPLPDLQPIREEITEYLTHMASFDFPEYRGNDKLMAKYEAIMRREQLLDLSKPVDMMELLAEFDSSSGIVMKNWPGGKSVAAPERDRWDEFRTRVVQPTLQAWREHRYEPVIRAIRPAVEIYDRLRRDRNALNFQDLLLKTVQLLRTQVEIRQYFRRRFTHLLVDEFQDTDPLQAEIMLLLTAEDITETDWQKCCPVPGSLFVVGDPKQSIYRFRRADIVTYSRVRSIVEEVGGVVTPLTTNFRSTRPVIEWINNVFSTVFPSAADAFNPADRPLDVGRTDAAGADSRIQRLLTRDERGDQAPATFDAEQVAKFIRQAVDEKWPISRSDSERKRGLPDYVQPGDFILVTRNTKRLTIYAQTLQRFGLPHEVTGGGVLNTVAELELLSLCVNAATSPDDSVALVAVLRSELFGISDTLLFDFRQAGGHFSIFSAVPESLDEDEVVPLRDALERLQRYAKWLQTMPPSAAIEKMAGDLGLIAKACANEEGHAHAGSLLKAMELLRSVDSGLSAGDAAAMLRRVVDGEDSHDGILVRPPEERPVRVMNLHQCKGLEAPFVFLVDPSGVWNHDIDFHVDRSGDCPRGYLAIYGRTRGEWKRTRPLLAHPPGWNGLAATEQQFLDAESQRLLYVAATRAGHRLVISQRDGKGNANKNPWQLFNSHLSEHADFEAPSPNAPEGKPPLQIDQNDWSGQVSQIESRWNTCREPTYAVQAIKDAAIRPGPKPHGAERRGAEWGQVIHTLLESSMKHPDRDIRKLAMAALEAEQLSLDIIDEVEETVDRVLKSDIWARAQASSRCLTEVPIAFCQSGSGVAVPTIQRGVIDLIFREETGWVLVDYKSERVEAEAIPALVAYYEPQIKAYADAWHAVVGEQVLQAGIYFTHLGQFVAVTVDPK